MLYLYTKGLIMSKPLLRETEKMVVKNSMFTYKRVLSLMFAETNKYFGAKILSLCLSMNA